MTQQDADQLRLISIFHYIWGAMTMLWGCFPLIHVGMGILILLMPDKMNAKNDPASGLVATMFIIIGSAIILAFWTIGILTLIGGKKLSRRSGYKFCYAVGIINCLLMPIGTVLGVFTILVLSRPTVKQDFGVLSGSADGDTPPSLPGT